MSEFFFSCTPWLWRAAFVVVVVGAVAAEDPVANAIASFRTGNFVAAEEILKVDLSTHPNDEVALALLAATLDQEQKLHEADSIYRKALALSPTSAGLLNNYGNHLLALHRPKEAGAIFTKVLALEPNHPNAVVQLARLRLEQKKAKEASGYLARLSSEVQNRPDLVILRMQTAYELHRDEEADALLANAQAAAKGDARGNFMLGVALAAAGENDKAEALFASSLALQPDNFEVLYDLGLAASHAGHWQRARQALVEAADKQPRNADVLLDLAAVDVHLRQTEPALELLVRARQLAPARADIQQRLARTAADAGYFGDAVEAWNGYLKLKPDDDVGRRERAFDESALEQNMDRALGHLRSYVLKHPLDAVGHYELGTAESSNNRQLALRELNRALALRPDMAAAHLARGLLIYRQGAPKAALGDFEKAAALEPDNVTALERLGQTYSALDRATEAAPVLRRAERLAPNNASVLFQLGRALQRAGEKKEATEIFARYRDLRATKRILPKGTGLVDWLSLSPDEQWARYRAGVERTIAGNPANVEAHVRYLGLLLNDGKITEAQAQARTIATLDCSQQDAEDAARLLLDAREYGAARELLDKVAARGIKGGELPLDDAIAAMHLDGAEFALRLMAAIPRASRTGDYDLARAMMLDAAGRRADAALARNAAIKIGPRRSSLYREEALLLLRKGDADESGKLLDKGVEILSMDPVLRTMRAVALALGGQNTTSLFEEIEDRWPEWPTVWIAQAFVLESEGERERAKRALDTAAELGGASAALTFCRALLAFDAHPAKPEEAKQLITEGLALAPENAEAREFAGFLSGARGAAGDAEGRSRKLALMAELLFR